MSEKQTFETRLEKMGKSEATGIIVPFDVEKVFGAKRVPVKISINNVDYRSTTFRSGGKYLLPIPKAFRDAAGVKSGEMITVSLEKDTEKRVVAAPEDFAAALSKADLEDVFAQMSYTHQKEYVLSIEEAKKEETRVRRIEKAIEQIAGRKKT